MKILILSTFGNYGGAAVCSKRLRAALAKKGLDVTLGVIHSYDGDKCRFLLEPGLLSTVKKWFCFVLERLHVLIGVSRRSYLYKFSSGKLGLSLKDHPEFKAADVVHLHWVNFGFVSIKELARLSDVKPVIWTLHDMWAFTGGCHYTLGCEGYLNDCKECFYTNGANFSLRIQHQKIRYWTDRPFKVVATSEWLASCANNSQVFKEREVQVLSTPIDTDVYRQLDVPKSELRKIYGLSKSDFYVLFGAVDLSDERKGFKYLLSALNQIKEKITNVHLLTFGKMTESLPDIKMTSFGSIKDEKELVKIFNMADVFVLPSVQDNLPNTVMEAAACGLPIVAFDCGGVNDMVHHGVNGYLAENKDSEGLVTGICSFLTAESRELAKSESLKIINENYTEGLLVDRHLTTYSGLIHEWADLKGDVYS